MNYRCVEIPEPDFDAAFTDEMVVTAYQDEDDFNPQMLDEYPNVRLTQLEADIQQTSLTAAEAFETANNAEELASQASQAATTATESANAAGSLAIQASQAAQEAAGIAEGAATTAGEAAQSINTHATATTNPHPTNVTQEFADTQITQLAVEATYTPTVWAYLVSLFTTVPKSVKEHIVKIWGVVNNLAVRIGLLEDNYLLKYVVPADVASINLTTDRYGNAFNFSNDSGFDIIIQVKQWAGGGLNRLDLKFNGINSNIYLTGTTSALGYIYTQGSNYASQYSIIRCEIHNNEIFGIITGHTTTNAYYPFHTNGFNSSAINTITLTKSSTPNIPTGAVILIKKK